MIKDQTSDAIDEVGIKPQFLKNHMGTIKTRLLDAGAAMIDSKRQLVKKHLFVTTDVAAINQCLHLASTVLLLGATSNKVQECLKDIKKKGEFSNQDPTTVITSAVLYSLLKRIKRTRISSEEETQLAQIHQRFDELQWMITDDGMKALGIKPLN